MKATVSDAVVLDASTALAWCFPDEASEYADDVLVRLEGKTILVPGVWALEIANAVLTGERKKRLKAPEIGRFADLLEALPIIEERQTARDCISDVAPLARKHNLSAYDAAYLGLAIRRGASLATLDARLVKAAKKAGIGIFASESAISYLLRRPLPKRRSAARSPASAPKPEAWSVPGG